MFSYPRLWCAFVYSVAEAFIYIYLRVFDNTVLLPWTFVFSLVHVSNTSSNQPLTRSSHIILCALRRLIIWVCFTLSCILLSLISCNFKITFVITGYLRLTHFKKGILQTEKIWKSDKVRKVSLDGAVSSLNGAVQRSSGHLYKFRKSQLLIHKFVLVLKIVIKITRLYSKLSCN